MTVADESLVTAVTRGFAEAYGETPAGCWSAPGRVNLIGEHTDYNEGFVLPFAIGARTAVAAAASDDGLLSVASAQYPGETVTLPLAEAAPGAVSGWSAYPLGVAWSLGTAGRQGISLFIDSGVPEGAGLSSSAALECAVASALNDLWRAGISRPELARACQRAENEAVGAPTGIMDQYASLFGEDGGAVFLDCRTVTSEIVPLDLAGAGLTILLADTGERHANATGGYASRRASCERAAQILGVRSLRDATLADIDRAIARTGDRGSGGVPRESSVGPTPKGSSPQADAVGFEPDKMAGLAIGLETDLRRALHIVTENTRVLEMVRALRAGALTDDPGAVGALLTASHESMRDWFEITTPALDLAAATATEAGAFGARMTGGGFGGSVLALVASEQSAAVGDAITKAFAEAGMNAPTLRSVIPSGGARREPERPKTMR